MLVRRLLAIACLLIVLAAAAWLLAGWSNLFGWPANRDLVVIAISPDTVLHYADGTPQSLGGSYMWAGPHTGQWLVRYGIPLAVIVGFALVPVWQLFKSPKVYCSR